MRLQPGQHIHLVGIGGTGLSAIARVLLQKGFHVSGSDRAPNAFTEALAREGATVYAGHAAAHVAGADALIVTSAASGEHVEIVAAREASIPVYKRSDVMAAIMNGQDGIAIAGTHGKTTTTAMTVHILLESGQQPSYIVGGTLPNGENAAYGAGRAFVVEADEYDNMFHGLRPQLAVVTNVEHDHPDFFRTPKAMQRSFEQFVALLSPDGLLIACVDDPGAAALADARCKAGLPLVTYGSGHTEADWLLLNLHTDGKGQTVFDVLRPAETPGRVRLQIPGRHNALNALAALIIAENQGVAFADAARALQTFHGAGRRFELRGEVDGVAVIDDYAHHPTAIKATLEATRQRYPQCAIWAVWQPHTYSRTQTLWDAYQTAFGAADHVLVTPIYAAREEARPGVTGAAVAAAMQHPDARHVATFGAAVDLLGEEVESPAVIIIMSAGDAPQIGSDFLAQREQS